MTDLPIMIGLVHKAISIYGAPEYPIPTIGWYYLPTPPLGQDMTQGQFLSGL